MSTQTSLLYLHCILTYVIQTENTEVLFFIWNKLERQEDSLKAETHVNSLVYISCSGHPNIVIGYFVSFSWENAEFAASVIKIRILCFDDLLSFCLKILEYSLNSKFRYRLKFIWKDYLHSPFMNKARCWCFSLWTLTWMYMYPPPPTKKMHRILKLITTMVIMDQYRCCINIFRVMETFLVSVKKEL